MTRKLFALVAATLLVFGVFGPGAVAGANAAGNDAGNDGTDDDRDGNATDTFGLTVSAFVHGLLEDDNETNASVGYKVATFVVANNPGNAPDHAGPPENGTRGPPENVTQGPPESVAQGPPEDAGPDGNETGPPEEKGPDDDRGPPEDAGPDEADEETDDEAGDGGGNGSKAEANGRNG